MCPGAPGHTLRLSGGVAIQDADSCFVPRLGVYRAWGLPTSGCDSALRRDKSRDCVLSRKRALNIDPSFALPAQLALAR